MRQILFNVRKMTHPKTTERPLGDYGPYVKEIVDHDSLSPCSFANVSHEFSLAMQHLSVTCDVLCVQIPFNLFWQAFKLMSPFGCLPCLIPPVDLSRHRSVVVAQILV